MATNDRLNVMNGSSFITIHTYETFFILISLFVDDYQTDKDSDKDLNTTRKKFNAQ